MFVTFTRRKLSSLNERKTRFKRDTNSGLLNECASPARRQRSTLCVCHPTSWRWKKKKPTEAFNFQCTNAGVENRGGFAQEWPWRQRQRLRLSGRRPRHYANIVRFNEARSPWSAPTHSALGAQRMREAPNLCGTSFGEESPGQLPRLPLSVCLPRHYPG